jgi:hypothetical protein
MSELLHLVGGPSDGAELPDRYADAHRIQTPVRDAHGDFATYTKDPNDNRRFLFVGYTDTANERASTLAALRATAALNPRGSKMRKDLITAADELEGHG